MASADVREVPMELTGGEQKEAVAGQKRKPDVEKDSSSEAKSQAPKRPREPSAAPPPTPGLSGGCSHFTAFPPMWETSEESKKRQARAAAEEGGGAREPARTWEFKLDSFQEKAIKCLEDGDHVLVAAHTSAGKTVVAEYAIALALRDNAKALYTTPIKALSNQKYRELKEEFGDVGLMTGDISIAPNASIVVLTTEILRNMLYRGSETLRQVQYIIFDEVHYMRDRSRGVVWEESIVLVDPKITLVFLSATLSNANQFAQWVAKIKKHPCHVVTTDFRPTPLIHYVFPANGDGLYKLVNAKGMFLEETCDRVAQVLSNSEAAHSHGRSRLNRRRQHQDLHSLMNSIKAAGWLPCIIFCFKRRECEGRAITLGKMKLTTPEEKDSIREVFDNALYALAEEDRDLEQVQLMLPLLLNGVGIHHSGLLPILKELVELLFQENLLKVLVATETFALGINMPARTVVFMSLFKFDGEETRILTSGEYIQMSGRAGRRGKDPNGICVIMADDAVEKEELRGILTGKPSPLTSTFRLSYNMLLNLLRIKTANPEQVVLQSFHHFQNSQDLPDIDEKLRSATLVADQIKIPQQKEVASYATQLEQQEELDSKIWRFALSTQPILPFLMPGRVVYVKTGEQHWGWGAVVSWRKRYNKADGVTVHVLLNCGEIKSFGPTRIPEPVPNPDSPEGCVGSSVRVVAISQSMIHKISQVRLFMNYDLRLPRHRERAYRALKSVRSREFQDDFPLLDPIHDIGANPRTISGLRTRLKSISGMLQKNPVASLSASQRTKRISQWKDLQSIQNKLVELKRRKELCGIGTFERELHSRMRVLRRLGHCSEDGVITRKGRLACEIESVDELVATELILEGIANDMTPAQLVAFLTCLYPAEGGGSRHVENPPSVPILADAWKRLREAASRVARVQRECGIELDEKGYVEQFRNSLVDVTLAWCEGKKFQDVMKMTKMFEGSLIRVLRRHDELLDQLHSAAMSVGDDALSQKFTAGRKILKRGVVFASSLYL